MAYTPLTDPQNTSLALLSLFSSSSTDVALTAGPVRVRFAGEQGLDAGGLAKDWVGLIARSLLCKGCQPTNQPTNQQTNQPTNQPANHDANNLNSPNPNPNNPNLTLILTTRI